MKAGTSMFMREVRTWTVLRTIKQIEAFRYRQINPRGPGFTNETLLSYIRLAGSDGKPADLAHAQNTNFTFEVNSFNIKFVPNTDLVVCPQQTYYSGDKCVNMPVNSTVATVYATSGSWKLSALASSMIQNYSFSDINIKWTSTDPLISYLIQNLTTQQEIDLPSSAFRDNSLYKISMQLSNDDLTFVGKTDLMFRPVSCHRLVLADSGNYTFVNNYKQPQATSDIKFSLKLETENSTCKNYLFFDILSEITYEFSPVLMQKPSLNISINGNEISVTIPKGE
jgi:hypothetical protein